MINIVFLCCEITKGMKSFGPKALIPMSKKRNADPLIIKQIKEIHKLYDNTHYKIHVVVGFEHDRVLKVLKEYKKINTIIYEQYAHNNSAGAVLESITKLGIDDYLFIENGVISKYKPKNDSHSYIPVIKKYHNGLFPVGVTQTDTQAEYLFYDLEPKWPEVVFLHKSDVDHIIKVSQDNTVSHMFLFEYINFLIESGISFRTDHVSGKNFNKIISHKIISI
jgi:hypothetical protein